MWTQAVAPGVHPGGGVVMGVFPISKGAYSPAELLGPSLAVEAHQIS